MTILLILGLPAFAWYLMEPDERARFLRRLRRGLEVAQEFLRQASLADTPYGAALRARTCYPYVTACCASAAALVFACMIVGAGGLPDSSTLLAWGGNFGPNTTHGEWGRLVSSTFVHAGPLTLLVNLVALVQLGVILERLTGHAVFAVTYLGAGLLGSVVSLHMAPIEVTAGASAAVAGLYGLLLAVIVWGLIDRSPLRIPLAALRILGPATAVFVVNSAADRFVPGPAESVAFGAGLAAGLVLTRDVGERTPGWGRVAATLAACVLVALGGLVAVRGIADVRPALAHVLEVESRTSSDYHRLVSRFRQGAVTARQLAQAIDASIRPELTAARRRLEELTGVPAEHRALVVEAETYLAMRDESWRARSDALRRGDMKALRAADQRERASLQVFERLAAAVTDPSG